MYVLLKVTAANRFSEVNYLNMFVVISSNFVDIYYYAVQFIIGSSPTTAFCQQHSSMSPGRICRNSG